MSVVMAKPGYAPATRSVTAGEGDSIEMVLVPVDGFNGVWQLSDGRFREFVRDTNRVLAWSLASASGDGKTELGPFEFIPSEEADSVMFARDTEVVDERNPGHASCRRRLGAQYRYHIADGLLEIREQSDSVAFEAGLCVIEWTRWGDFKPIRRIQTASTDHGVITVSSAGAGGVKAKSNARRQQQLDRKRQLTEESNRKRQLAREQEKQLEAQRLGDVSERAGDSNAVQQEQGGVDLAAGNIAPAPRTNPPTNTDSLKPSAQRQTTRAPVQSKKAPPQAQTKTKTKPRTKK
jgi:hypothetical protein